MREIENLHQNLFEDLFPPTMTLKNLYEDLLQKLCMGNSFLKIQIKFALAAQINPYYDVN